MKTYWISFASNKSLGVCIVDAFSERDALAKTIHFGINPGGEAMFVDITDCNEDTKDQIKSFGKNKLLSPQFLLQNNCSRLKDKAPDVLDRILNDSRVSKVCEYCNEGRCEIHNQ